MSKNGKTSSNASQNEHKLISWKSFSLHLTKIEYFVSGEPQRRARNEVWRLCAGCVSPDYGLIFLLCPTSNIMLSPSRQDTSIWKGRKSNSNISYSPFQTQCALFYLWVIALLRVMNCEVQMLRVNKIFWVRSLMPSVLAANTCQSPHVLCDSWVCNRNKFSAHSKNSIQPGAVRRLTTTPFPVSCLTLILSSHHWHFHFSIHLHSNPSRRRSATPLLSFSAASLMSFWATVKVTRRHFTNGFKAAPTSEAQPRLNCFYLFIFFMTYQCYLLQCGG